MNNDLSDFAQKVLFNLIMYILKMDDAPCSAETHFDQAIFLLSEACPEWTPDDLEVIEIIRSSREHMAYYHDNAKEPWPKTKQ